jgi:4-hydroxy-2-oxoheptanedioate aldolase
MAALPRLNSVIRALENDEIPISVFTPPTVDSAVNLSTAPYDGIIFESEHNPYDIGNLRDCLQYLLNRRQIVEQGTLAPPLTPLIRIPPNGAEMNLAAHRHSR